MISLERARETIYTQDALLSVKRSAWALYQYEMKRINPRTQRRFTRRQALANILRWMSIQKNRGKMSTVQLSPTQKRIVGLIASEGLTRKQVASRLNMSENTLKTHLNRIKHSIGVSSLHQVVAIAVEYGWACAPQLLK